MNARSLKTLVKDLVTVAPEEIALSLKETAQTTWMFASAIMPWNWRKANRHGKEAREITGFTLLVGAAVGYLAMGSALLGAALILPALAVTGGLYMGVTSAAARIGEDIRMQNQQPKTQPGAKPAAPAAPQPARKPGFFNQTLQDAFRAADADAEPEDKPPAPKPPAPGAKPPTP